MRKILVRFTLAAVLSMVIFAPVRAFASPVSDVVIIGGRVTDRGSIEAGFPIAISCKGRYWANFVAIVHTTPEGYYGTHTTTALCPLRSTVEVRIDVNGDGKFEAGTQGIVYPNTTVNLFVELGNTVVPEFGWLSGAGAASAAIAALAVARKRARRSEAWQVDES